MPGVRHAKRCLCKARRVRASKLVSSCVIRLSMESSEWRKRSDGTCFDAQGNGVWRRNATRVTDLVATAGGQHGQMTVVPEEWARITSWFECVKRDRSK